MSSLEGEARMAAAAGDRKTLEAAQRNARRHAHRLERADRDGRWPCAARRRVSPRRRRPLSGDLELRPLRQGARLPGRLSERLAAHGGKASRRHRRLQQSLSELGSRRSGEMGAARLRLRARRFARRRLLARLHRSFFAARDQGFLRLHRMGRRAAVVERQGRAQRHFLLRHQPVARGIARTAASCRHVHLGRRRRLVSRHDAPRRHSLHVLGQLVRHAGQDRAIRRRRARQTKPRARRTGLRAGSSLRRGARQKPQQFRRRHRRASARRRLSPRPFAGLVEGEGAVSVGGQLGRARRCIRAAISKASSARRRSKSGSKCTASSTGRISTPITAAICNCASSIIFCTARKTAGTSSRRCSSRCAMSIASSSARRRNGRSSAPNGRKFYLDPAERRARRQGRQEESRTIPLRGDGRRRHLPDAAAGA